MCFLLQDSERPHKPKSTVALRVVRSSSSMRAHSGTRLAYCWTRRYLRPAWELILAKAAGRSPRGRARMAIADLTHESGTCAGLMVPEVSRASAIRSRRVGPVVAGAAASRAAWRAAARICVPQFYEPC